VVHTPEAMLVVERGVTNLSVIPLLQPICLLGRSPTLNADQPDAMPIVLANPHVSRHHAQIILQDKRFSIRDLGSKNGTFVNGQPVDAAGRWLQNDDRIELARGQVVLSFHQEGATATVMALYQDDLLVDTKAREIWVRGKKLDPPLPRKEFALLELLYQRREEACSKDQIAAQVWPERSRGEVGDQDIDQCIRRLRLRIELVPSHPSLILTVRGYGYKLSQG